jgi:hypothetical protein
MGETKACPFCAETIQAAAVVCRHCQSDLRPGSAPAAAPDIGQDAGMRLLLPVGRSGWAIAAGYLGLFSFLVIFAPIGLVVSIVAALHLKKHPELHGWGRTIFGLIASGLMTVVLVIMIIALIAAP